MNKVHTLRHPERAGKPINPSPRKPPWIRVRAPTSESFGETRRLMRALKLNTVCEEAACPNIGECWAERHATVMILGDICTRACAFCNVATGRPGAVDPKEPEHLGTAAAELGLKHMVVTSVDRDDLDDGGAGQFALCIESMRELAPGTTIEVLTPRFPPQERRPGSGRRSRPRRLQPQPGDRAPALSHHPARGRAIFHSLRLLERAKELDPCLFTKSGMMVGLGEEPGEVNQVMDDLRTAGVDFLTIGQYLQPTPRHAAVARYVTPDEFDGFRRLGLAKGFLLVAASPLTRSSYHAGEDFERLRRARIHATAR